MDKPLPQISKHALADSLEQFDEKGYCYLFYAPFFQYAATKLRELGTEDVTPVGLHTILSVAYGELEEAGRISYDFPLNNKKWANQDGSVYAPPIASLQPHVQDLAQRIA